MLDILTNRMVNAFFLFSESPSACRNIRATSMKEINISISWEIPATTGRDDFYYTVEYTDGESIIESDTACV